MKCVHCYRDLRDFKAYQLHCNLSHPSKGCVCPVPNCHRSYSSPSSWKTLIDHFKKCPMKNKILASTSASIQEPTNTHLSQSISTGTTENFDELSSNVKPTLTIEPLNNFETSALCDKVFSLRDSADTFVSSLYAKPRLPRQYVQNIIQDVSKFISEGIISNLRKSVLMCVETGDISSITKIFNDFEDPFKHVSSEYMRFKYFVEKGQFISPVSYEIGEIDTFVDSPNGPLLKKKKCFGESVPLDKILKKFLEVPNALSEILDYTKTLESDNDTVKNFMQCNLWKRKRENFPADAIVLPLHCYYDEFQVNNPLGSHCGKLGGAYVQIPCLPPECCANTDNIFLALVFNPEYRCFSDSKAFAPLISQLKYLEEHGIIVETSEGPRKVFFVSGLLLGDNLGVNSVGGFVECFTANHFCRFCRTHKTDIATQCVEDRDSLRTKENYEEDLSVNNVSVTGVKNNCAFNSVPSFHISENFSVDVFHDLNEGVCHYVMVQVLSHCTKVTQPLGKPRYFSLDILNRRMEFFQFGPCDSNKFPLLSDDCCKRDKLKMSGSEMLLFVKMFGVLIGDMVPRDDEYWKLFLKLRELLDVVLSPSLSYQQPASLKVLVEEFNLMYITVTNESLKAKFHNLVHYPRILQESGPVSLMSTKSFERKHRSLTIPAHATQSRRYIEKTVAIHHQLTLCLKLKSRNSILPETVFGPCSEVFLSDFQNKNFVDALQKFNIPPSCLECNWVEFKGYKFKPGMVLVLDVSKGGCPRFGVLESILLLNETDFVFIYSYLVNLGFDDHRYAYTVQSSDKWGCVVPCDLIEPLPLSIHFSNEGKKYVVLRHAL